MKAVAVKVADVLVGIRRLFLDTSPVIYHVEGVATYQPLMDLIFREIRRGTVEGVTSSVTFAECLVHPYRRGDVTLIRQFRNGITAGVNTRYVGVDAVAEDAAELRARYNIGLADAFLTNDVALKCVSELSIPLCWMS
ncbi:MAG: hypothetical protein NZT92_04330 [Abditibacteriales bacterium]|nr:hypothetical protein [Abditibacteriales bacterium]MDW8364874.1 hypothetical protein [Abditibacteriales bacterium]